MALQRPSQDHERYVAIARLVAGETAPAWLADHFRRWAPSLYLDRHVAAQQPTRAQMREWLQQMATDPEFAEDAASEIPIREFLEAPPLGKIEAFASAAERAEDLRRRAARAARSPALANEDGTTRNGAGKAQPDGCVTDRLYCALLVREAWAFIHGEPPRPGSARAAEAADACWVAACGSASTFATDRLARKDDLRRWRHQFKALNADPSLGPAALIAEIRRSLRLAAAAAGRRLNATLRAKP